MMAAEESQIPLLEDTVDGSVDYKGDPAGKTSSGGWRSASFIIGVEIAERFAFYGISSNLITYLTGELGQSTVTAAENVNLWSGTASLLPLLGAFLADTFVGRYRTIVLASAIYILGLGFLTLSAMLPLTISPQLHLIFFFFSLYLVALGQGGHKPCVQAFGADQFDGRDSEEAKAKSSFFNWWTFGLCAGSFVSLWLLNYIQDNVNWALGFGIPCIAMIGALVVFLLGTKTYRFSVEGDDQSPFLRIGRVFIVAIRNWRTPYSTKDLEADARGTLHEQCSQQLKFLNKALLHPDGSKDYGKVCSVEEVDEAKAVIRLIPIWGTSLLYAVVYAQSSTFFTKQGLTMDRSISTSFKVPAASLQSFISLSIVLFIPIYDRILVPFTRQFTQKPGGFTMLQRIGIGMFLSALCMMIAALVEMKRLKTAQEHGLIDIPNVTVPMSVWWLLPQYVLSGVGDVFTMVGLQEFFYDQVPNELRSVGLSLYLSIFGVGSFLSSFLISVIDKETSGDGKEGWFDDNLNKAHIDYFYWLLAALSFIELAAYLYFSRSYIYNKGTRI